MSKLLTILLAGAFATGAAIAQTTPATGSDKGSDSTRSSTTAPGAGSGATTSGGGSGKTSAEGGSTGNTTATTDSKPGAATGAMGASGDSTFCPPGLEKKDNNCMPPGQADKSGASSMNNKAMGSDKADGEKAQDRSTKP